jgi:hypothetical protein
VTERQPKNSFLIRLIIWINKIELFDVFDTCLLTYHYTINEYDHVITFLDRLFELFRLHVQFYLIKAWFSSFLIIDLVINKQK